MAASKEINKALLSSLPPIGSKEWLHIPCRLGVHPKDPNCWRYYASITKHVFLTAAKMYGVLFLVTAILRRKGWRYIITRILPSTARSAAFLGVFGFFYAWGNCTFTRLLGGHYPSAYFISGFVAAFVSILVEHKARRSELMLYTANVSAESIYNMLVHRGYLGRVPHGTTLIFAGTWSALSYLFTHDRKSLDNVQGVVHTLLGEEHKQDHYDRKLEQIYNRIKRFITHHLPGLGALLPGSKSRFVYSLLGFARGLLLGFFLRAGLSLLSLVGKPSRIGKGKWWIKNSTNASRFAAMTALLSGGTRGLSCLIRCLRGKEDGLEMIISGFVSGLSYKLFDSHEVAMILGAKAMSGVISHILSRLNITPPEWGPPFLYAFNTAVIFYQAIYEPYNLRKSYWKFLLRVTNNDIGQYAERAVHWRRLLCIPEPKDIRVPTAVY